jgi:hypothetical protein
MDEYSVDIVAIVGAFSLRLEEDKSDTAWKPIWVNKK